MKDVNKFYEWLVKMKSIHLADRERMSKAYDIVYQNSIEPLKQKQCTQST